MRFLAILLLFTSVASAADVPATGTKNVGVADLKHRTIDFRNDQPRPIQGMYAPQISPDGKQLAFTALGDIWIEDIDAETLAQKKPLKARRLFRDPALDLDAAWAPDGSQIAFVSDREDRPQIWLRDLTTNKERKLTTAPEQASAPVWSPDSKRIAFFKVSTTTDFGKGRLNVVNVFTGDVKEVSHLMRPVTHVSWSQDGKTLVMNAVPPSGGASAQFLLVSLSGAPDRYVTPLPEGSMAGRGINGPVWSPDGSKMAYVHDGLLWTVPVVPNGPKAGEITGPPEAVTTELADAPSWTADSKSLLYLATDHLKRIDLGGETTDLQPNTVWHRNPPHVRMVVWAGRLWDGLTQNYRTNVDIVIDGNVISAVEPHQDGRKDAVVVNASRDTVMPGLIESSARMDPAFGNRYGRLWLSFGITSVLEPNADPYMALERRESWASGVRPGPRAFFGVSLDNVSTPTHLGLEIARAHQLDADAIRTDLAAVSFEKTVAAKAREIGLPVSANAMYPGIGEGVNIIDDLGSRGANPGDVVDLVAKSGAILIPALAARGGYELAVLRNPALLRSEQMQKLFREEERTAFEAAMTKSRPTMPALQQTVAGLEHAVRDVVARSGRIAAGSGAPAAPYGLSFLIELQLYQEAGLTPLQVLQAATSWPAAALGVDKDLGTVEPGKLADLLIVGGDPLKQVGDLIQMHGVVADGHYYLRDELLRTP